MLIVKSLFLSTIENLQLPVNSLALRYRGLNGVARLRVLVLTKNALPELQVLNVVRGERGHQDLATSMVATIRVHLSCPVRDWPCGSCPYASRCVAG